MTMNVQQVEELMATLDGEWVTLAELVKLTGAGKEDLRPMMAVLLEMGVVNQKVRRGGRYFSYLYRRATFVCPECNHEA